MRMAVIWKFSIVAPFSKFSFSFCEATAWAPYFRCLPLLIPFLILSISLLGHIFPLHIQQFILKLILESMSEATSGSQPQKRSDKVENANLIKGPWTKQVRCSLDSSFLFVFWLICLNCAWFHLSRRMDNWFLWLPNMEQRNGPW